MDDYRERHYERRFFFDGDYNVWYHRPQHVCAAVGTLEYVANMGRTVILHGGVNRIDGDVEILEVHGGAINVFGRVGAVNQFGGVLNGKLSDSKPSEPKVEYRDRVAYRDRVVYRERPVYREKVVYQQTQIDESIWIEKITSLENEMEREREQHRKQVALLEERLQGALDAYHRMVCQVTVPRQSPTNGQSPGSPSRPNTWDDYRPTKAECEAVYKNLRIWMECENELEPINL